MNPDRSQDECAGTQKNGKGLGSISPLTWILAASATAWIAWTSQANPDYLPLEPFVGCYVSTNGDALGIDGSGTLRSRGTVLGTVRVFPPVGEKGRPLLVVDGLKIVPRESGVAFERGQESYFWPISGKTLQVTYPARNPIVLSKVSAGQCR